MELKLMQKKSNNAVIEKVKQCYEEVGVKFDSTQIDRTHRTCKWVI